MKERKEEKGGREEGRRSSLVPRPCAFVACSTKFCANFILQASNAQGLGMRLEEERGGRKGEKVVIELEIFSAACTCMYLSSTWWSWFKYLGLHVRGKIGINWKKDQLSYL